MEITTLAADAQPALLVDPRALAVSADGILALADGDQILVLDPSVPIPRSVYG